MTVTGEAGPAAWSRPNDEAGDERDDELIRQAWRVGHEVAGRLSDPAAVEEACRRARRQTSFPSMARWTGLSIASGDAGLAVLAAYLDAIAPDAGWDRAGHEWLASAASDLERRNGLHPGLFDGACGVAFAAALLGRDGTRYRRLLSQLDASVVPMLEGQCRQLGAAAEGVPVWTFDVISGLAGSGAYMLTRVATDPGVRPALEQVLQALTVLVLADARPPLWFTPPSAMEESMARHSPYGNLNCGLAHGIPGVLALLSLAWHEGVRVPRQQEAIRVLADWLTDQRLTDAWGVTWPATVSLPPPGGGPPPPAEPSRAAWCYGTPGVARALWLGGRALDDDSARALAVEGMAAVYRRPAQELRIPSPTFCHGIAGLLHVTLRFWHDTGAPVFAAAVDDLLAQVLAGHDPERPVGYATMEGDGVVVDQPGLLDGAAGVALTLLAAGGGPEPSWDRLFLLS